MGSKRQISLVDLRKKQEQIAAAIVAVEQAERGKIGARIQAMTGLETLEEIEAQYTIYVEKKSGGSKINGILLPKNDKKNNS